MLWFLLWVLKEQHTLATTHKHVSEVDQLLLAGHVAFPDSISTIYIFSSIWTNFNNYLSLITIRCNCCGLPVRNLSNYQKKKNFFKKIFTYIYVEFYINVKEKKCLHRKEILVYLPIYSFVNWICRIVVHRKSPHTKHEHKTTKK